jgi:hypothetical protein
MKVSITLCIKSIRYEISKIQRDGQSSKINIKNMFQFGQKKERKINQISQKARLIVRLDYSKMIPRDDNRLFYGLAMKNCDNLHTHTQNIIHILL